MVALSHIRLRELVEPVVVEAGYDVEDLSVTKAGRRSVVRVVVDRDGGLDLDAVAEVSRAVSAVLDDADPLGDQPYVLEVTSPGVERALSEPRHWRRNVGRLVETGSSSGRIVEVTGAGVVLEVDGQRREIGFGELGDGRIILEFTRHEDAAS
jgi:ribosome maturation factor RimP